MIDISVLWIAWKNYSPCCPIWCGNRLKPRIAFTNRNSIIMDNSKFHNIMMGLKLGTERSSGKCGVLLTILNILLLYSFRPDSTLLHLGSTHPGTFLWRPSIEPRNGFDWSSKQIVTHLATLELIMTIFLNRNLISKPPIYVIYKPFLVINFSNNGTETYSNEINKKLYISLY